MRKLLKILGITAGAFLALLALASLLIHLMLPPAKLRHLVEDKIRSELHREAQLGDVRIGLGGLTLDRFKLSEVPAFSAGTFLAVEQMTVSWSWLPLLSKIVVINQINLQNPQITLIRMADGKTMNISDLSNPSPARRAGEGKGEGKAVPSSQPSPGVKPGEGAWTWKVNEIKIRHGLINFDDRSPLHQTSALSNIDLLIRGLDPTRAQGTLTIGELQNPVYTAHNASLEWALHGIDPSLAHLDGWMKLKQGPGMVQNLNDLVNSSPGARLALMPLVMLQKLDRLGFLKLGLPDFSHLPITGIDGDYTFKEGTMTINTFKIESPQATIGSSGSIDIARGPLDVNVALHTPKPTLMGEMDLKMHITGTMSNPKTDLDSLKKKAFKATVKQLLDKPNQDIQKNVNDALKNIFH